MRARSSAAAVTARSPLPQLVDPLRSHGVVSASSISAALDMAAAAALRARSRKAGEGALARAEEALQVSDFGSLYVHDM